MVDKIVSIFTTALVVTGVAIALDPKSRTPEVIGATLSGFAGVERSARGLK